MTQDNKESAAKFLSNASTEHTFWCSDGKVLTNMAELEAALKTMSKETYASHANKEKNDFSNWIKDIFNDAVLAEKLKKAKDKSTAAKYIKDRIKQMKTV